MDVTIAGDAITYRPNDDQLGGLSLEFAAFDGEVGIGQVPVPDPTAAISYYDGRQFRVDEGATLLTDGFIVDQDRERGPMPADPARLHTFSVMDANALLDGFRVEQTRPSETDVERVLAFAALDGPDWATDFVIDANTVTMPAKVYSSDGGWTSELIPDVIEFTGKTLFLHDLTDGSGRCLHYHTLNSGHTCGLSISDQTSNGPTTWNPNIDQRRQRTSVDLRNDIKLVDQTGRTSTVTDATSISRHDADGLQHQALINVEADSQADLDIKAAALLASSKDERDTWTVTIGPLDEDALALIRAGDLMTVTSSVMGLSADVQRIAHMSLHPVIGESGRVAEGYWYADLELGAPVRRRARVTNKSSTFADEPWVCDPVDPVPWTGSAGLGSCIILTGEISCATDGSGAIPSSRTAYLYQDTVYRAEYTVDHSAGSNNIHALIQPTSGPATDLAVVDMGGRCAGSPPVIFASTEFTAPHDGEYRSLIEGDFFVGCGNPDTLLEAQIWYVSGPDVRFAGLGGCKNGAPRVNQLVKPSIIIGDGTTDTGTTDWPYVPGSLRLFVNGLDWTPEVSETNPRTRDFTVAYSYPLGSTVQILYRRAA